MKARVTAGSNSLVLSVGMIVKNEEKYLDRCLSAISPLLKSVSSELVIVDTGSTDNTVEIAKKYTDKIYHFDWVDDFSAARNYSLEKCKGEWFMYLDADDIFDDDCGDIIKFFKNRNMLRTYNSAVYNTKNYYDTEGVSWSMLPQYRIIKRFPGAHFVCPIHECFSDFPEPTYALKTFAHHYGYAYENEAEKNKKLMRNLPLLYKELEKDPDDLRTYLHIYSGVDDAERIKFLPIMIDKARKQTNDIRAASVFLQAVEFYYEKTAEIDLVLNYIEEYLSLFKKKNVLLLEITACKGLAYLRKGDNKKAAEAFAEYLELYKLYTQKKLDLSGTGTLPLTFIEEAPYQKIKSMYDNIAKRSYTDP